MYCSRLGLLKSIKGGSRAFVVISVLHISLHSCQSRLRKASRFGINKWYQSFALRNFDLEDMELESTNIGPTAKLPILKLENGDSWVSVPQTTQENGTSVTKMSIPVIAKDKTNKKNDVKARSLLLMALSNENQLIFSQYPDAKSMFAAIETRFRGNAATKKTSKTLLKQQYENFSATSVESLDSIFNRLQKIVIVCMNKPEVETMSIDDLYNNFKIVEQNVKKTVGGSSGAQNLAFMTAPSTNSTNDTNTASLQVSIASPNVNAASPQVSTASVSDNTVYAFMVENPNGSNVQHQDLEQIHEDDLKAMDLKWLRIESGGGGGVGGTVEIGVGNRGGVGGFGGGVLGWVWKAWGRGDGEVGEVLGLMVQVSHLGLHLLDLISWTVHFCHQLHKFCPTYGIGGLNSNFPLMGVPLLPMSLTSEAVHEAYFIGTSLGQV
ncbi:hypothetical protein Tco_1264205 [Tanacetum coccineum]